MPKIEFFGVSARDSDNIAVNPSRLVNLYREPIAGIGGATLKSVLATVDFAPMDIAFGQAVKSVIGRMYAIADGSAYSVGDDGSVFRLGDLGGNNATISGNNGNVTFVCGGVYGVWDGISFTRPSSGAFSVFGGHDYIGNYTVLTEANGARFQWSNLADAKTLNGLNFSTADGRDDRCIRPIALNGALYIFKQTSFEVWYLTGGAGAEAFERQSGGVVDVGLRAHDLICKIPQGAFFVGSDGRASILSGQVKPVSIPAVETSIRDEGPLSCFTYEDEGHTFCGISFQDRPSWIYDVSTGEWHERASGIGNGPWPTIDSTKHNGAWYVMQNAKGIFKLTTANSDSDSPLVREATSMTLYQDGQRFVVSLLELFPRQGFSENGLELLISRDGGITWGEPKPLAIGPIGKYGQTVRKRALGQFRQITAKVRFSENAPFSMMAEGRIE